MSTKKTRPKREKPQVRKPKGPIDPYTGKVEPPAEGAYKLERVEATDSGNRQGEDFLINEAVVQSKAGPQWQVYSPYSSTNVSYVQNSQQEVKAIGWGIGIDYVLPRNFNLYGNVFSDELRDVPEGAVTFFNAPKYRFNIGLRNDNLYKNIGFNVVVKWQDNNYYEGTFVTGTLPYFTWVDAQVTYRPPGTKSTFRVGGTNLGNNYYRTGFGSPAVGGLYYASFGYNIF